MAGTGRQRRGVFGTFVLSYLIGIPVACGLGSVVPTLLRNWVGLLLGVLFFLVALTGPGIFAIWYRYWRVPRSD